jgi:hypothetical protein
MDVEFNRTTDARVPRGVLTAVRRVPGSRLIARVVPRSVKGAAKRRMLTTRVNVEDARMPDDLRNDLEQLLRDDVRLLRPYLPTGFDGWGIA